MRRAIILNPKLVNANLWLGMLLRQTGKLDEAETYLKEADQLSDEITGRALAIGAAVQSAQAL